MARSRDDQVEDLSMEDLDADRVEWIDTELAAPRVTTVLGSEERRYLRACCDANASTVLTWPDLLLARKARFAGLDRSCVSFELEDPFTPRPPSPPQARCCVCFDFLSRTCAFIGLEFQAPDSALAGQVVLRLPTQLAIEGRARLRIPVLANAGLRVTAEVQGEAWLLRSIDISETGMLIAFPNDEGPELTQDEAFSLTLELGDVSVSLPACVRRSVSRPSHTEYGLQFHRDAESFASEHDQIIRELVVEIERFWARSEEP